jgi:hypothetical protein
MNAWIQDAAYLISKIQSALTPELLKPPFKYDASNPTYGFCYVASECLYHLYGRERGYKPARGRDESGTVHWWLLSNSGEVLDPTAEQYTSIGKVPPYASGRQGGFLTRAPSKRARILIDRIRNSD